MGLRRMFLGFTTEEKSTLPSLKEHLHSLPVSAGCQRGGGVPRAAQGRGSCPVWPWEQ